MKAIPSYIKKVTTLKDKSLQLTVETQEVDPETSTYLFRLFDKYGWFFFFENLPDPEKVDVPAGNVPEDGDKTPAQRLRAVLFVLWKHQGQPGGDFEFYYRQEMGKIIEHFKSKLPAP